MAKKMPLHERQQPATRSAQIHPATYLFAARALRDFGDGFVAVLLPVYLLALGFAPLQVGVIATASLLGSALLTIGVGILGARYDHRQLLLAAASLMIATGVAFAVVHDYALLLVDRVCWHRSTRRPAALASSCRWSMPCSHAKSPMPRGPRCSRATALWVRSRPRLAHWLRQHLIFWLPAGLDQLTGIKAMFVLYALLGLLGGTPLRADPAAPSNAVTPAPASALGPSRNIVFKLAALFSLDAFAGGFVVQSLLALWLFEKFDLSLSEAGFFFFWSGVLSAFSFPIAAWLSRHIGLINTMVFTHIPSSIALMLAALAPTLPSGARLAADPCRAVADGRPDAIVLRHGRCHGG